MSKFDDMQAYLPEYLRKIKDMNMILEAEAPEFEKQNEAIFDTTDQLFISTATWGLQRWEKNLNVIPDPGDDIEVRRARLLAKASNIPPVTFLSLEKAINRFIKNPSAMVRLLPKQYRFSVDIDVDDLQFVKQIIQTIEDMKPAHLGYLLRAALNETIQFIDEVTVNRRRYRKVRELKIGYSVTLDNNEVILR
ncbi:putative phage tail protein [Terribacillus saccharophilus]|uniref:putative phage tail protein n=1 Tax=Terribacillus saccharophilus TaxID=361277 RepID=UPI003D295843